MLAGGRPVALAVFGSGALAITKPSVMLPAAPYIRRKRNAVRSGIHWDACVRRAISILGWRRSVIIAPVAVPRWRPSPRRDHHRRRAAVRERARRLGTVDGGRRRSLPRGPLGPSSRGRSHRKPAAWRSGSGACPAVIIAGTHSAKAPRQVAFIASTCSPPPRRLDRNRRPRIAVFGDNGSTDLRRPHPSPPLRLDRAGKCRHAPIADGWSRRDNVDPKPYRANLRASAVDVRRGDGPTAHHGRRKACRRANGLGPPPTPA